MVPVRVMKVPVDEIVDVVAVGHRRVATVGTVHVVRVVPVTLVGNALGRVGIVHLDRVLVVVALVRAVEMPVVKVADVIPMPDRDMAAVGSMRVVVILVNLVCHSVYSVHLRVTDRSAWSSVFSTSVRTCLSASE